MLRASLLVEVSDGGQITPSSFEGFIDGVTLSIAPLAVQAAATGPVTPTPPVVSLTEDNQTLTVSVDGVRASVQTRDIKFGGTLPTPGSSVRGEVYAIYGNGYRDANLHIFDGTTWHDANLNVGDFEVRGNANFVNAPTSTAHSDNEIREWLPTITDFSVN